MIGVEKFKTFADKKYKLKYSGADLFLIVASLAAACAMDTKITGMQGPARVRVGEIGQDMMDLLHLKAEDVT